jgi:rhodanese-related sulfurtransferase
MLGRLFLIVLILLIPLVARADKPIAPESVPGTIRVAAEQVVELATSLPELVIIDSRFGEEFAKGHIEGAINLVGTDLQREDLARVVPSLDTPVLFYCNGERCIRSSAAAKKAVTWGYRKVYWFRDGWQEWTAKQLPVSK